MGKFLFLGAVSIFLNLAHAQITPPGGTTVNFTVTDIHGASAFNIVSNQQQSTVPGQTQPTNPATGTATVTVWGGTAGLACTGSDQYSTCDSCKTTTTCADTTGDTQGPLCSCNTARIYDNLVLVLTVAGGDGHTLRAQATNAVAGQTNSTFPTVNASGSSVSVRWGDLCSHMATQGSCEGMNQNGSFVFFDDTNEDSILNNGERSMTVTVNLVSPQTAGTGTTSAVSDFNIYGAPNSVGIGQFTPFPGDDRIYFDNVNTTTGFGTFSYGGTASGMRVFVSKTDLASALPSSNDGTQDVGIENNGDQLSQDYIDNVDNGTTYFVRIGITDQAANLVQLFPDNDPTTGNKSSCFTSSGLNPQTCIYAVTPDQVLGLLSKDVNCFIATAAYGTTLEPKLTLFRRFRRVVLLPSAFGRKLVHEYYTYGPYAARFIADKPILRAVTRGILWPIAGFTWLTLEYGLALGSLVSLAVLTSALGLSFWGLRRFKARA